MGVPDEVLWEIENKLGVEIRGGPIAYEGGESCDSPRCRRWQPDGPCAGWHCGVCGEPSSMYGHAECREGVSGER